MHWQDPVIAVVVLVFSLTVVPLIRARIKVPLWTSIPMIIGCAVLAVTYSTLGLWYSVSVEVLGTSLWITCLVRGQS